MVEMNRQRMNRHRPAGRFFITVTTSCAPPPLPSPSSSLKTPPSAPFQRVQPLWSSPTISYLVAWFLGSPWYKVSTDPYYLDMHGHLEVPRYFQSVSAWWSAGHARDLCLSKACRSVCVLERIAGQEVNSFSVAAGYTVTMERTNQYKHLRFLEWASPSHCMFGHVSMWFLGMQPMGFSSFMPDMLNMERPLPSIPLRCGGRSRLNYATNQYW